MRRTLFLATVLLFLPVVQAQDAQQQPTPVPSSARRTGWDLVSKPATDSTATPSRRPTDLDILTGKADREARERGRYASPYMYGYGDYGYRGWGHGRRGFIHTPFSVLDFRPFPGVRVFTMPRGRFFLRF